MPASCRMTTICAAPCSGRPRSSTPFRRYIRRSPSRISPPRPINGRCHKAHGVTWSSLSNEWWGPGLVLRRYCNESKHTVFEHPEARARSRPADGARPGRSDAAAGAGAQACGPGQADRLSPGEPHAAERGGGRSDSIGHDRPAGRGQALFGEQGREFRDLRGHPHPRRDARRGAQIRLDAPLGASKHARDGGRGAQASRTKRATTRPRRTSPRRWA